MGNGRSSNPPSGVSKILNAALMSRGVSTQIPIKSLSSLNAECSMLRRPGNVIYSKMLNVNGHLWATELLTTG